MNTNEAFLFYEEKIDRPMPGLTNPDEKKRLPWLLQAHPKQDIVETFERFVKEQA